MRAFYNILTLLIAVVGLPLWVILVLISPKRRRTVLYRLGIKSLDAGRRRDKSLAGVPHLWIHALSVGELNGAESLIKGINALYPDWQLTLSISTLTGFELACKKVAPQVHHLIYFPYDFAPCVRRAVNRINPTMTIWVESDIWPNLLWVLKDRTVPILLANARLSERSFKGYHRLRWIFAALFGRFDHIVAQSAEDARRFRALGVSDAKLTISGNIKFDQSETPSSETEFARFNARLGAREGDRWMIWGSTHPGEEAFLLESCGMLLKQFPELQILIAPRDPRRAPEICDLIKRTGWPVDLWTQREENGGRATYRILVVDVIGILRGLYALADIAVIGGSFKDHGGHNPLEPAFYAKPIVFGPHMGNFTAISQMLLRAGGAVQVSDPKEIASVVCGLLDNTAEAHSLGIQANQVLKANAGAVECTLALIKHCLDPSSRDN